MKQHKHISYYNSADSSIHENPYYILKLGERLLGRANIRNDREFMFQLNSEYISAFIDKYILVNIIEILDILNAAHGLKVEEETEVHEDKYEF